MARATKPRVDLVQCFDEMIISYGQTRDLMLTNYTKFPFLSRVNGFYHVILLDGRLLGHWRAPSGGSTLETRTDKVLDKPRTSRARSRHRTVPSVCGVSRGRCSAQDEDGATASAG